MGWEQSRGFSHVVHCWRRAEKGELCMPWVCWMGVRTALCSRESPFHLWDQVFSLCANQTTTAFSRELWICVPFLKYLHLCLLPPQELLWALGGWVLRTGADFSHVWRELLACVVCWVQGKALRTVLWDQPPGSRLPWPNAICLEMSFLQNSYETIFPLAVVMGNVLLGITQFLSEQWCHCIQALGSSYFWRRAVFGSKALLCSYHTGGKMLWS